MVGIRPEDGGNHVGNNSLSSLGWWMSIQGKVFDFGWFMTIHGMVDDFPSAGGGPTWC